MWEYLIAYGPAQGDAPWVIEERIWNDRPAMEAALIAEGWEVFDEQAHRADARQVVFRRKHELAVESPRHLIPCW
jgi:hypothetical protein